MIKMSKHKLRLVISYESSGGMGEHDAIEEGLINYIERSQEIMVERYGGEEEDYRKFTVESVYVYP